MSQPQTWPSLLHNAMQYDGGTCITIATVEKGKPRARTVLFSGLVGSADDKLGLAIKTDARSNKVQAADNKWVEIVWWMDSAGKQFRFSGQIDYESHPAERESWWNHLRSAEKEQFYWPAGCTPDVTPQGEGNTAMYTTARAANAAVVPDSFCYGVVYPQEVDMLDLMTCARWKWGSDPREAVLPRFAPPVVSTTYAQEKQ